jgi:RNA polymerase sigma-70 factor (ECF subfamily)
VNSERTAAPRDLGKEWAVVQQAIAGSPDAQERLFAAHTRRLYRIVLALLNNKEDAEHALQEGSCKAFTSLRSFQGRSSFSTWLTRIVINSALMARRRKSADPEASLDEMLDYQPKQMPRGFVDPRPDPERLYAINGISGPESSKALGISPSAFKSRIFRARLKLACGLHRSLEVSAIGLMLRKRGYLRVKG